MAGYAAMQCIYRGDMRHCLFDAMPSEDPPVIIFMILPCLTPLNAGLWQWGRQLVASPLSIFALSEVLFAIHVVLHSRDGAVVSVCVQSFAM